MNVIELSEDSFIIKYYSLLLFTKVNKHNIIVQVKNVHANIADIIELLAEYFKADANDMIVDEVALCDAGIILPTSLKCLTCSNNYNVALNGTLEGISNYRKYFSDNRVKYIIMPYSDDAKQTKSCTEELAMKLNIKIIHILNRQ